MEEQCSVQVLKLAKHIVEGYVLKELALKKKTSIEDEVSFTL